MANAEWHELMEEVKRLPKGKQRDRMIELMKVLYEDVHDKPYEEGYRLKDYGW